MMRTEVLISVTRQRAVLAVGVLIVALLALWVSFDISDGAESTLPPPQRPPPKAVPAPDLDKQPEPQVKLRRTPPTPRPKSVADKPPSEAEVTDDPATEDEAEAVSDEEVEDAMKVVMKSNAGQLKFCYERALADMPDFGGEAELRLTIEGGRAVSVQVEDFTDGDQVFTDCIADRAVRWDFSSVPDTEITWPLIFRLSGD